MVWTTGLRISSSSAPTVIPRRIPGAAGEGGRGRRRRTPSNRLRRATKALLPSRGMRWIRTGVAALACTAFLAACGGEDDSLPQTEVVTPSTTESQVSDEPISTEDFLAAGDEICVETFSAISAAEEDESDDAELYETRAGLYEEMIDELQGLGTPEDEASLEDLYAAADDLVETNNDAA